MKRLVVCSSLELNPRWGSQSSIRVFDSAYDMPKVLLATLVGLPRASPRIPSDRP